MLLILSGLTMSKIYSQAEKISEYNVVSNMFRVDNLGYFYFVSGSALTKTDSDFNIIASYDSKNNGEISDIDATDPFRLLIFYKDFNKLVFLDNELAELRDPVMLDDLQVFSVDAVCSSTQGSFRLFDGQKSTIVSYDKDLNLIQTGVNLYSCVKSQNAYKIRESNNYVFAQFGTDYIVTLDKFGNFYKKAEFENIESFDFVNDNLYLLINSHVYKCNPDDSLSEIVLPIQDKLIGFAMKNEFLFVLSQKSLITFKIL
jgi:hypothetical protein